MTETFCGLLKEAAEVLAKYAEPSLGGELRWNGATYAPTATSAPCDPYAAKWWGILTALSGMLAGQDVVLSDHQRAYLDRLLFGGMGSFNDFVLDEGHLGSAGLHANQELNLLRRKLFDQFQKM